MTAGKLADLQPTGKRKRGRPRTSRYRRDHVFSDAEFDLILHVRSMCRATVVTADDMRIFAEKFAALRASLPPPYKPAKRDRKSCQGILDN